MMNKQDICKHVHKIGAGCSLNDNCNYPDCLVEQRTSDYVCIDCGVPYLTEKQKKEGGVCTFHVGECGVCRETTSITHMRHYNYLTKVNDGRFRTNN